MLCQLPTLHHLRHLNIFATAVSLAFAGLVTVYCFIEGAWSGQCTQTASMPASVAESTPGCSSCCQTLLLHKVFRAGGCVLSVRLRRSCCNWLRALRIADNIVHHMPMRPVQARGPRRCSQSATMWCRATSQRRSWAASQRRAPWRSRLPTSCCQRCTVPSPAVLWWLWREAIPASPMCSSLNGGQGAHLLQPSCWCR